MKVRKVENKDWSQNLNDYMKTAEGEEAIKSILHCLKKRHDAVNEIQSIMQKFTESEEYDKIWKDDKDLVTNEKMYEEMVKYMNKHHPDLLDCMKSAAVHHITISFILNNLSSHAVNFLLDDEGLRLFNDCIKTIASEDKKGDLFMEFFDRITKISNHFCNNIMHMIASENRGTMH